MLPAAFSRSKLVAALKTGLVCRSPPGLEPVVRVEIGSQTLTQWLRVLKMAILGVKMVTSREGPKLQYLDTCHNPESLRAGSLRLVLPWPGLLTRWNEGNTYSRQVLESFGTYSLNGARR